MPAKCTRFCAAESIERGDDMVGTATVAACFLLVECDGQWPINIKELFEQSRLSSSLTKLLREFIEWCPETVHPLLIKQKRSSQKSRKSRIYVVVCEEGRQSGGRIDFSDESEVDLGKLKHAYSSRGILENILLICTHGKRDKCCAKFGPPVFNILSKKLLDFEVYQSSHVGGDRFAANVIWLPYGLCFGHVQTALNDFAESLHQELVLLKIFRGSVSFPSAAQYLEGVVREKYRLVKPCGVSLISYSEEEDDNGYLVADAVLRISELDSHTVRGRVRIRHDESTGPQVLASCNEDGFAFRRAFDLLELSESD